MRKAINLLPQKARLQFAKIEKIKRAKQSLILLATVFFLFSALVLGVDLVLKKENRRLNLEMESVRARLEKEEKKEQQLFLLKQRIGRINKILEEKKRTDEVFWQLISLLPEEAQIESAEAEEDKIEVFFFTASYQQAGLFVDHFPQKKIEKLGGKTVSFPSIARKEGGRYLVGLRIIF